MWIFLVYAWSLFLKNKTNLKAFHVVWKKKSILVFMCQEKNIESLGFSAKILYWVVEKLKIKMNNLIIYCDIGDFLMILYNEIKIFIFQKEEKRKNYIYSYNWNLNHDKRGNLCDVSSFYSGFFKKFNPIKCITHQDTKNQLATKQQKVSDLVLDWAKNDKQTL